MKYQEVYRMLSKKASLQKKEAFPWEPLWKFFNWSFDRFKPAPKVESPVEFTTSQPVRSLQEPNLSKYMEAAPADQDLLKRIYTKNTNEAHSRPSITPTGLLNNAVTAAKWLNNPVGAIGAGVSTFKNRFGANNTGTINRYGIQPYVAQWTRPINYGAPAGLAAQAIRGNEEANKKLTQGMNNWAKQQIKAQQNKYK